MRQQQHIASCQETYLTVRGLTPEKVIYFDIETTGFRASTSQLYMIGWAVKLCPEDADTWMITQLLAETAAEEALILQQFLDVLKDYDTIVEFNGDRFDLPYLREKCASHQMGDPFEGLQTVDLYQEIRPCKSMLGMSRLNQKSVEQFLQISRKDPYNGGELIQVYREVRNRTAEDMEASVSALFLHNYEDVLGMLAMTPIVSYPLICAGDEPVCCRIFCVWWSMKPGASFSADIRWRGCFPCGRDIRRIALRESRQSPLPSGFRASRRIWNSSKSAHPAFS